MKERCPTVKKFFGRAFLSSRTLHRHYADSAQYLAEMLEIGEKTVYRELVRMRQELREALQEEGIVI